MSSIVYPPHKSSIGNIDANIISFLAYLIPILLVGSPALKYLVWIAPLIMYFVERDSGLVKFHAMQSFVINAICNVINFVISVVISGLFFVNPIIKSNNISSFLSLGFTGIIGFLMGLITFGVSIAVFVFSIISIINAYKYNEYEIPFINLITEKIKKYIK